MFVYDALLESIKYGNTCITGPTSLAKRKLEKLSKLNPTTEMSGYESQFKVCFMSILKQYVYILAVLVILN